MEHNWSKINPEDALQWCNNPGCYATWPVQPDAKPSSKECPEHSARELGPATSHAATEMAD